MLISNEVQGATDVISTAVQFINSTSSHIFLTGKAGTGKTTFLKNLSHKTHKQFAVIAPTGIAALNAGGVTIHSQFLLPFGMFIPDKRSIDDLTFGNFYSSDMLARKHPLDSARKQVLRSIDLLVIDEVSMLRADLLDAIDYRMKAARGNFTQSFGGVQLLLIGDLFQLPPVVKRGEEYFLKQFYNSPWFFESRALQQDGFVYIELDKIFRQQDDVFIRLLNNLRNNQPAIEDIDELNRHYKSPEEIQNLREVITLTTHNYKADELNARALNELKTHSHFLRARVEGDFPESMYPVLHDLELKEGAQIMFVKNDSEGKMYFNGKLATVLSIEDDDVQVELAESGEHYILKKEVWENKRYTIDPSTQEISEKVIGTFEQYPVKLAWAITVHKSQGLTFDKAIIDVGQAFADGQVYVALSRLRSLDGLILRTRINPHVISTDKNVESFTHEKSKPDELSQTIKEKQREYMIHLIDKTFDFEVLIKEIVYINRDQGEEQSKFADDSMKPVLEQIRMALLKEKDNTQKFRRQLHFHLQESDPLMLFERIKKGSEYYKNCLQDQVTHLLRHIEEMRQRKRVKAYLNNLNDLDLLFSKKLEEMDKLLYIAQSIFETHEQFDFSQLTTGRATERERMLATIRSTFEVKSPSKGRRKKGRSSTGKNKGHEKSTYDITLELFQSGLTVEAVAEERGLTIGTIESHLAKAIGAGRLSIYSFMTSDEVKLIIKVLDELPQNATSKDLFKQLEGKFSYGKLRAAMNHKALNLPHSS
ncbi:MAG TPA: helix-turn-helix domain-containing protein [Cyclobacteriaceae bacterium]|nr:helix-turn-helix domain-containing protein [Cyclobacteriaceae bacterium]